MPFSPIALAPIALTPIAALAFPRSDFVFGNETEAAAFSKANELGTEDVKEIALKIADWEKKNKERPRIAVITQGAESTIVAVDGKVRPRTPALLSGVAQSCNVFSRAAALFFDAPSSFFFF